MEATDKSKRFFVSRISEFYLIAATFSLLVSGLERDVALTTFSAALPAFNPLVPRLGLQSHKASSLG